METSHILNTLNMIKQGRMKRPGCSGLTNAQWVRIFNNELAIRRHRYEQAQEQIEERKAAPRTPPG